MNDTIFHYYIIYTCNTIAFLLCIEENFIEGDKTSQVQVILQNRMWLPHCNCSIMNVNNVEKV